MGRFIALDIETTSVTDVEEARIVSIYAAHVEWPTLKVMETRWGTYNPGIPIPIEATARHGIRDQDVARCDRFRTKALGWQKFLSGACIIAYNAPHDVAVMHHELVRAGQPGLQATTATLDPLLLFREDYSHPHSLSNALQWYCKLEHVDAHNAKADVQAMLKVLKRQLKTHDAYQVLHDQTRQRRLDFAGHFIQDETGTTLLNFGRHKGQPAKWHLPYLQWMRKAHFPADTMNVATRILSDCANPTHDRNPPDSAMHRGPRPE